ncbi:MAG TPA: 6-pyruvoyl-tetrahydropterin synthase-related protein [Candidatus Acidoferrales bacterium]|nr:6-pyruvoyl-tetrahydropterin synthase-related protein [Candidatus Acidoferrales bacterium]
MPMLFLGNASGHDFDFHVASWMDVAGQWREGIVYPRWAEWANWGFGEPRFIFYPPASWIAGAALGSVLPWRMVPGVFIWLTLVLAGMSMWILSREWLPPPQAVVAALLYPVNPYNLVIVYYRSDFAELLAGALFPLLIWGVLRVLAGEWRRVPTLVVIFAAVWLTNAPAAVIATYSLVLILLVGCLVRKSLRPLLLGASAMGGGFALAAFYILPAAWERRWVQIARAVGGEVDPSRNFLFTRMNDPDFVLFNGKVSWIAAGVIAITGIAAIFAARKRRYFRDLWWIVIALALASVFLMLRPSLWLWNTLPELRFIQFPWRWLEPLAVAFAFFLALAIFSMRSRPLSWTVTVVAFIVIGATATTIVRNAYWDDQDVPSIATAISSRRGYEGTDEFAPTGLTRLDLPANPDDTERPAGISPNPAPQLEELRSASGSPVSAVGIKLNVDRWSAERKAFTVESVAPVTLALRLVDYPSWEVQVDAKRARTTAPPATSQILVPLAAGDHRVDVRFRRTWDRSTGDAISGLAVALLGFTWVFHRRRESAATVAGDE